MKKDPKHNRQGQIKCHQHIHFPIYGLADWQDAALGTCILPTPNSLQSPQRAVSSAFPVKLFTMPKEHFAIAHGASQRKAAPCRGKAAPQPRGASGEAAPLTLLTPWPTSPVARPVLCLLYRWLKIPNQPKDVITSWLTRTCDGRKPCLLAPMATQFCAFL